MTRRSAGRAAALQCLYEVDSHAEGGALSPIGLDQVFDAHFENFNPELDGDGREFAEKLCRGVCRRQDELDELIDKSATGWRVARMSRVDRNVIRLAVFEMLEPNGPPPAVVVNEAVELAKTFGSTESGKFVNGVLARVLRACAEITR